MHEQQEFRAAAWAPYADFDAVEAGTSDRETEVDWVRRRDLLAAAWVQDRAACEGVGLILRTPSHANKYRDRHTLSAFAAKATVLTNRGPAAPARGATLVHEGYAKEIAHGMVDADGSSILVTEHPAFSLAGWAMTLGAFNLRTKRPTPDTRTPEQVELIDSLVDSLYGGWSHQMGKKAAKHYLPRLAEAGMTRAIFKSSILALAPERCDVAAIEKNAPAAWRDEVVARRARGYRF